MFSEAGPQLDGPELDASQEGGEAGLEVLPPEAGCVLYLLRCSGRLVILSHSAASSARMCEYAITGVRLRGRVPATAPDPASPLPPDLFRRDLTAPEPGMKTMGGIMHLPLAGGEFLCPATVPAAGLPQARSWGCSTMRPWVLRSAKAW
jgi:hypothetical protein